MDNNQSIIQNFIRDPKTRMGDIDNIMADVAKARLSCELIGFALSINEDLMGKTRGAPKLAFARQLAMYLTHVGFGLNQSRVAIAFARDRSTIAHACHLIEDKRDEADFDDFVDALEQSLTQVPKFKLAA